MLTEGTARLLLVLHTALAVAAIGAATHLVVWLRRYRRGELGRHRAVRRFALYALVLHAGAFACGLAMYPTYRVTVRAAYLEAPGAVTVDLHDRAGEIDKVAGREGQPGFEPPTDSPRTAAKIARWFDVKEHWVALALLASAALCLFLRLWDPKQDGLVPLPVALGLAYFTCFSLWLAAVIGVVVSSVRAV